MIITIDGPSATGKSTIAKKLASELGYIYFDTGAMYRCLTYDILQKHVNLENSEELSCYLKGFTFEIKVRNREKHYFVNKEDVTEKIRSQDVSNQVSKVSALGPVREKLVALQKELATGVNAVFEGRDMGTVVFPSAQLKIFLIARPETRAARRFAELKLRFPQETQDLTLEKVTEEMKNRDEYDSNRPISPLKKADDAFIVDTSDLSLDEVVMKILECKDSMKMRAKP
jgi:cytidylate kinase